jgi:recombination protein RecT
MPDNEFTPTVQKTNAAVKQQITIRDYITAPNVQKKMAAMFSEPRLLDGFTQSVIALAGSDDLLAKADPRSVFNAALQAASLNLSINKNLGYAFIIGYENRRKGIVEAQFQVGAKGLKQLAQRTGQYKFLNDSDVRQGEIKSRNRLTGGIEFEWVEDDEEREKLPIVGYVCYFELKSGFSSTLYMTVEQIEAHARKYSQAYQYDLRKGYTKSPWSTDKDGMSRKTVVKLNINRHGPMSTELQRAIELDQAVVNDDGSATYIDGEVTESEDKEAITRKRIEAAEKKRAEMDSAEHKPSAVASSPAVDENDADVTDVDVEAIKNGSLLDDVEAGDEPKA